MNLINAVFRALFQAVMAPLLALPPVVALIVVSLLLGIAALFIFRWTSNQRGLTRAGDRTRANLLAMRLYAHDNLEQFKAIGGLGWASILRVWHALFPALAILVVIFGPLTAQMAMYWEFRPLAPGEELLVQVRLSESGWQQADTLRVAAPEWVTLAEQFRDPQRRDDIIYRLTVADGAAGSGALRFELGGQSVEKSIAAAPRDSDRLAYVSPLRPTSGWAHFGQQFLYPGEPALPPDGPIREIALLEYPARTTPFLGMEWHWLVTSFVWMMIGAIALLPFVKVKF